MAVIQVSERELIADQAEGPLPSRLPCGSLRSHGPHTWIGQTTGGTYRCSGATPRGLNAKRSNEADQRLADENAGITDSWRES